MLDPGSLDGIFLERSQDGSKKKKVVKKDKIDIGAPDAGNHDDCIRSSDDAVGDE